MLGEYAQRAERLVQQISLIIAAMCGIAVLSVAALVISPVPALLAVARRGGDRAGAATAEQGVEAGFGPVRDRRQGASRPPRRRPNGSAARSAAFDVGAGGGRAPRGRLPTAGRRAPEHAAPATHRPDPVPVRCPRRPRCGSRVAHALRPTRTSHAIGPGRPAARPHGRVTQSSCRTACRTASSSPRTQRRWRTRSTGSRRTPVAATASTWSPRRRSRCTTSRSPTSPAARCCGRSI